MENGTCHRIQVERNVYDQELLHKVVEYEKPKKNFCGDIREKCRTCRPADYILKTIPILDWMSHYKWRSDFIYDLIAGITVAVMQIPQGMGYALLANVPPVVGLYSAFFPVIIYTIFGTSRHVSMGTFAIVCLMTGKAVSQFSTATETANLSTLIDNNGTEITSEAIVQYSPIEVAAAVAMLTGIIQLLMFVFRLGIVSTLLSDTLVNGFVTGAAIHVITSQIRDIFGLSIPKTNGVFKIIFTYIDIFKALPNLNVAATFGSVITITILIINNEVLKGWVSKRSIIPIPIELILVVIGTLVSKYIGLPELYGLKTIGEIPTGLPIPTLPSIALFGTVALDSLTIAMVSYTISLSMALMFAQQVGYEVNANQELLAQGLSNIFGSCFASVPSAASLSRSSIQRSVGGKTQLTSLISCGLLLIVLLWIAPFFETLPKCVLASIIVIALKGMLMQASQFMRFWHLSKFDAAVWILTFLSSVLLDIDIGLLVGIIVSLAIIFIQGIKPYTCLLGSVPKTDLYLDINRYKGTFELPGIKIFHYCGGLNFASRSFFKSELYRLVGVNPQDELKRKAKLTKIENYNSCESSEGENNNSIKNLKKNSLNVSYIIIDFSALTHLDPSGVTTLLSIADEYKKIDIPVFIACCSGPVYEKFVKCTTFDNIQTNLLRVFPTVHDAVESINNIYTIEFSTIPTAHEIARL